MRDLVGNIAQSNHYMVSFSALNTAITRHLSGYIGIDNVVEFLSRKSGLLCSDAVLPTSSFATGEVKDNFMGIPQEFAHTRIYTDLDFTFYVDRDYTNLMIFEGWMDFVNDIQQMRQEGYKAIIEAQNDNPEIQKKYGVTVPDYDTPDMYWRSDNIRDWSEISEYGTGKEKAGAIKWYMDGIEKILKNKKYLEQIEKMLRMGKGRQGKNQQEWDELVLSEIKILKVIYHPSKVYTRGSMASGDATQLITNLKKSGYRGPVVKMGDKGGFLRDEMQHIKNLNGRIVLNAKMGKNFPTKYKV